jgi:hypothetical protein
MRCAIAAGAAVRARASKNRDNFMVQKSCFMHKITKYSRHTDKDAYRIKKIYKKRELFRPGLCLHIKRGTKAIVPKFNLLLLILS